MGAVQHCKYHSINYAEITHMQTLITKHGRLPLDKLTNTSLSILKPWNGGVQVRCKIEIELQNC
jgi:hypothetical protein